MTDTSNAPFTQVNSGLTVSPPALPAGAVSITGTGTGGVGTSDTDTTGAKFTAGVFAKKYTGTAGGSNIVVIPFLPKLFFILDETGAVTNDCMVVWCDAAVNPVTAILVQNGSVGAGLPTFKTGTTGISRTAIDVGVLSTLVFASQVPMNQNGDVYYLWGMG